MNVELEITGLASGGDGVARDANGRVTFVPRTVPGDRVLARIVRATKSLAHAEMIDVVEPSPSRIDPPCPQFDRGCGGCTWQHVARPAQLAAKQAIVAGALRKLVGLVIHPIADPAPAFGWRRRARFHVVGGKTGLFATGTHRLVPIDHCPQLEPALDAALAATAARTPPDGELTLLLGHQGDVVVGVQRAWRGADKLVGRAAIRGVVTGDTSAGARTIELEPGLAIGPWDFAQASAAGNAALVALVRGALGRPVGAEPVIELHAGAGNFTRAFVADGWDVRASDAVAPAHPPVAPFEVGAAADVLSRLAPPVAAIVLDPPRTGAAECIDPMVRLAPTAIIYVSCDPATLARDLERLAAAGYRATDAWPIDLMPQTSHIEVVTRLVRA